MKKLLKQKEERLMKSVSLDLNGTKVEIEEGLIFVNTKSGKQYVILGVGKEHVHIQSTIDSDIKFKVNLKKFLEIYKAVEAPKYNIFKPDPEHFSFSRAILYPDCIESILTGISRIQKRPLLEQIWNIKKLEPVAKTILSLYGPSGTGKTLAAKCIATQLNMPMLQADYAEIECKWVGDTGKNIKAMFETARKEKVIVFLDEADSLVTTRVSMHSDRQSAAIAHNNALNVFMQELDRFDGIVIMTSNFFGNYDPALIRRIAQHVHFKLPDQKMRERIFIEHVPNMDRVRDVDWKKIAIASRGFSGGDIFQVMVNAINLASLDPDPATWYLNEIHLMKEIQKTALAKREHEGQKGGKRLSIPTVVNIPDNDPIRPSAPISSPRCGDLTHGDKQQWKEIAGDSEERQVQAIKRYLLTPEDKDFLITWNLSVEDIMSGRWNKAQEPYVFGMFERWNTTLGFKEFGTGTTIQDLEQSIAQSFEGTGVTSVHVGDHEIPVPSNPSNAS